jgi:uncharacterized membrane protein YjgN (DUF898 family)
MDQMNAAVPLPSQALRYDGKVGQLYGIFLLNILLTLVTLGIFRFWAMARVRRYLWSRLQFQGRRLEYTGTGGELFLGFLLAGLILLGVFLVTAALFYALSQVHPALSILPILGLYVVLITLGEAARFSAQRYRLSRTVWSGIRGGMEGSALAYGAKVFLYRIATVLTLLQLIPWASIRISERRINASSFGSAKFHFEGRAGQLYLPFLLTLLGTVVLFAAVAGGVYWTVHDSLAPIIAALEANNLAGLQNREEVVAALMMAVVVGLIGLVVFSFAAALLACWYSATFIRHVAGRTTLAGCNFSSTVTGRGLVWLFFGNFLIVLFTLGLGFPFVVQRSMNFTTRNLLVSGSLDEAVLQQSILAYPRVGEGMYQQLDAGAGIF